MELTNFPKHVLLTVEDVRLAIKGILDLLDNPRRSNPVTLPIIDPRPPPKAEKPAKEHKETEMAFREELAIVKEHLKCDECSTGYCFRHLIPPQKNKPDEVPRDCSIPPNSDHIHLADGPLGPAYTNHAKLDQAQLGKRTRAHFSDDDDDDDDDIMPDAKFPKYKDMLHRENINYCHELVRVSGDELQQLSVGLGAVKDLISGTRKALRKAKKQRVGEEKENEP
ncbi:hypothetical protein C8F01DRAFT_1238755 [Mycena amicta]|nr:hypothetical protein C8F01DRAFT_1238755 [Mycena amicta]